MFGNFPQLSCPVLDFVYKEVFCFVLFCFNYRFYFTCSDQSVQIIFLFLIHFWFVGIYLFIVFCYLFIYFWYIFCMLLLPLFLFLFYLGLSFLPPLPPHLYFIKPVCSLLLGFAFFYFVLHFLHWQLSTKWKVEVRKYDKPPLLPFPCCLRGQQLIE